MTVFEPDDRRYRREVKSHVTQQPLPVVTCHGRRVTHPFRTFVDLAGWISLVDLVVLGDAMLRVLKLRVDDLVAFCSSSTDYYAGLARDAASYVREGVDSPMETRLRMLIVLAGLPEPTVNHLLLDEQGRVRRRLDLSYPSIKLIIEYDGRQHVERIAAVDVRPRPSRGARRRGVEDPRRDRSRHLPGALSHPRAHPPQPDPARVRPGPPGQPGLAVTLQRLSDRRTPPSGAAHVISAQLRPNDTASRRTMSFPRNCGRITWRAGRSRPPSTELSARGATAVRCP